MLSNVMTVIFIIFSPLFHCTNDNSSFKWGIIIIFNFITYLFSSLLLRNSFIKFGVSPKPNNFFNLFLLKFSSCNAVKPFKSNTPITRIWLPAKFKTFSLLKLERPLIWDILFPWRSRTSICLRHWNPSIFFNLQSHILQKMFN